MWLHKPYYSFLTLPMMVHQTRQLTEAEQLLQQLTRLLLQGILGENFLKSHLLGTSGSLLPTVIAGIRSLLLLSAVNCQCVLAIYWVGSTCTCCLQLRECQWPIPTALEMWLQTRQLMGEQAKWPRSPADGCARTAVMRRRAWATFPSASESSDHENLSWSCLTLHQYVWFIKMKQTWKSRDSFLRCPINSQEGLLVAILHLTFQDKQLGKKGKNKGFQHFLLFYFTWQYSCSKTAAVQGLGH